MLALLAGDTSSPGIEIGGDGSVLKSLLGVLEKGDPSFDIVTAIGVIGAVLTGREQSPEWRSGFERFQTTWSAAPRAFLDVVGTASFLPCGAAVLARGILHSPPVRITRG